MSRPSRKSRWYSRYSPRSASQKARFCESNAPVVMTGSGFINVQWMPSVDWNAYSPCLSPPTPNALYVASGAHLGFVSRNGTNAWAPTPSQTMLFCFESFQANSPSSGFVHWMPSELSA